MEVAGRNDSQDGSSGNIYHGGVRVDNCTDITFENCVWHDQTGSGILTGSTDARNITMRGCLLYNIGIPGFGKHHGFYVFNKFYSAGSRQIIDGNIFMHIAGYGIHAYSTGTGLPVSGIYCSNNIIRDSRGSATNLLKTPAILQDGHLNLPGTDCRFVNNSISQLNAGQFFRLQNITSAIIHSNYFQMGAGQLLFMTNYTAASFKSNTVVSSHSVAINANADIAPWATYNPDFNFNTYKLSDANPFSVNSGNNTFATWQSTTGDDANSTISTSTTTGLTIKYYPNRLDPNLVYFAIFNEASASTVDIDLSTFWPLACGTYEVRNAGNYKGALAASGAWTGQSAITITMTGQSYAQPIPARNPNWTESTTFFAGIAKRIPAH